MKARKRKKFINKNIAIKLKNFKAIVKSYENALKTGFAIYQRKYGNETEND